MDINTIDFIINCVLFADMLWLLFIARCIIERSYPGENKDKIHINLEDIYSDGTERSK